MKFHLVCVHPFGPYTKGQLVTDPDEIAKLTSDREKNFVRIAAPVAPPPADVSPYDAE